MLTGDNADALYREMTSLVAEMPSPLWNDTSAEAKSWFGRAYALMTEIGELGDAEFIRLKSRNLGNLDKFAINGIETAIYRSLHRSGLYASPDTKSAFIPAGKSFDAFASIARILRSATSTVLLVDLYADASLLTDFASTAGEAISVFVLAEDGKAKPGLKPAVESWRRQHGDSRPLEARLAPRGSMHDRLILVDNTVGYLLTQSFNALAARSPAALLKLDTELLTLKNDHYHGLWEQSAEI